MKRTFKLEHPKIKVARLVDSIRHDIKKNLKKERNKPLPSGTKYWLFNCKVGVTQETAEDVALADLNTSIDAIVEQKASTVYVEITPKAMAVSCSEDEF